MSWRSLPMQRHLMITLLFLLQGFCIVGCGSYDRTPLKITCEAPAPGSILSHPIPMRVIVRDRRYLNRPNTVGIAASTGLALPQYASCDVKETIAALLEKVLTDMGFRVSEGDEDSWSCSVYLKKIWVQWPSGVSVSVTAESKFRAVIDDSEGRTVWNQLCHGKSTDGPYAGGLVNVSVRERLLNASLHQALEQLIDGQLVAVVGTAFLDSQHSGLRAETAGPITPITVEQPVQRQSKSVPIGQRWAVVIGVASYEKSGERLEALRYADEDAKAFRGFLISKAGGSFPASHVLLLTNEQATTTGIRKALFSFLKKAIREDLVIVYFSGHGAADPDRPKNLYLLTYDTDPADISGTAFPMDDVKKALANTIEAQRVVVLADACHSGGVAHEVQTRGVRVGETNEAINKYWEELSKTAPGRVIFTSSERSEISQESAKWGGGHGVFTWALLEGLKGAADYDGSGIVTLGEVIRYTDERVRRETKSAQHPTVAGEQYDPALPMGVVK